MIIGFLSPDGEFVKCNRLEHAKCAEQLAHNFHLPEYFDFELLLGNNGWCVFQINFAGFNSDTEYRQRFTDKQIKWINQNFEYINKKQRYFISQQLQAESNKNKNIPQELLNARYCGLCKKNKLCRLKECQAINGIKIK